MSQTVNKRAPTAERTARRPAAGGAAKQIWATIETSECGRWDTLHTDRERSAQILSMVWPRPQRAGDSNIAALAPVEVPSACLIEQVTAAAAERAGCEREAGWGACLCTPSLATERDVMACCIFFLWLWV